MLNVREGGVHHSHATPTSTESNKVARAGPVLGVGGIDPILASWEFQSTVKDKCCTELRMWCYVSEGIVWLAHVEHRARKSLSLSCPGRPPKNVPVTLRRMLGRGKGIWEEGSGERIVYLSQSTLNPWDTSQPETNYLFSHSFMSAFIS